MKHWKMTVFVLCIFFLCSLCGCENTHQDSRDSNTIWIVTEKTESHRMNGQAKRAIQAFESSHENMTIELEILPESGEEREVRLEQLRTEILAGHGPDGYLLPCCNIYDSQENNLILDVELAMHNGIFADISSYYDADEMLNTEGLVQTVMDAGVIGDARYVLPLRYDYPILVADTQMLEQTGLNINKLEPSIMDIWNAAFTLENQKIIGCTDLVSYYDCGSFSYLPAVFKYETNQVILDRQDLITFLQQYNKQKQLCGDGERLVVGRLRGFSEETRNYFSEEHPFEMTCLSNAYEYAAIAKVMEREITMIPVRAMDGNLVAGITYYAAVGANSAYAELTYQFLRTFLMEKLQWEQNRPYATHSFPLEIERGWPVRSEGSIAPLWECYCKMLEGPRSTTPTPRILQNELTDADVPILTLEPDRVRFYNASLEKSILENRLELIWMNTFSNVETDVEVMADEIIMELEYHISEG